MQNPQDVQQFSLSLRALCPQVEPRVAIVLGTGLGALADAVENATVIPYESLPGFPRSTVLSHQGRFVVGTLEGIPVICQQGRCHLYEGYSASEVCTGVRLMHTLGARSLFITCAAGAINPQFDTGDLMLITDHINQTGQSPLTGKNHDAWGTRFPDMSAVYDKHYQALAMQHASKLGIRLERGVYLSVRGPQMETPAETRMFRTMGADAIGMSTVLEVIAAHHLSMRILGIASLTNKNLPDCMVAASHEDVIKAAQQSSNNLEQLIRAVLADI